MTIGIYKITEKETGRCYIGQSKNIEARWKCHKERFSIDKFDYEVIVTCPVNDLNELEILMIETFDSHRNGFNKTLGGTGIKATHPDEETRRKISEAAKGRKYGPLSEEHRKKLSESGKGREVSEETRQKLAKSKLGKKRLTKNKRKPHTEEARKKMSVSAKNRQPVSEETKQKMSDTRKGKKLCTTKVKCPHCLKEGRPCNMGRWHFDNCKKKVGA